MTAVRALATPTGLRHGDHVCWTFADDAEFSSTVTAFLDEGGERGEQLLVVGANRTRLLDTLAELTDRDVMLAGGQLEVWTTPGIHRHEPDLDPAVQADALRRRVGTALAHGRSGLRVAADGTPLARGAAEHRRRLHRFERLADDLAGSAPMTGMCLYDATLADDVLGPALVLHPLQHHGVQRPLAHLAGRGRRLALSGEVDFSTAGDVYRALVDVAGSGEVALDLTELDFLDVAGARALALAVRSLAEAGTQLRLTGARRTVARGLGLFGLLTEDGSRA